MLGTAVVAFKNEKADTYFHNEGERLLQDAYSSLCLNKWPRKELIRVIKLAELELF